MLKLYATYIIMVNNDSLDSKTQNQLTLFRSHRIEWHKNTDQLHPIDYFTPISSTHYFRSSTRSISAWKTVYYLYPGIDSRYCTPLGPENTTAHTPGPRTPGPGSCISGLRVDVLA